MCVARLESIYRVAYSIATPVGTMIFARIVLIAKSLGSPCNQVEVVMMTALFLKLEVFPIVAQLHFLSVSSGTHLFDSLLLLLSSFLLFRYVFSDGRLFFFQRKFLGKSSRIFIKIFQTTPFQRVQFVFFEAIELVRFLK